MSAACVVLGPDRFKFRLPALVTGRDRRLVLEDLERVAVACASVVEQPRGARTLQVRAPFAHLQFEEGEQVTLSQVLDFQEAMLFFEERRVGGGRSYVS